MTFLPEIVLPDQSRRRSKFSKWIEGREWNYFVYIGIVGAICFVLAGFIYMTGYDTANSTGALIGSMAVGLTIFIPSIVGFFITTNRTGQQMSILAANRSVLHKLYTLNINNSVILASANAQLNEYDPKGNVAEQFNYGFYGRLADGGIFTIGQLANAGPYSGYGCATIEIKSFAGNILVDACKDERRRSKFNFRKRLDKQYKYDLEGAFIDRFDVYAPDQSYMRAVTYIFTPDLMQQILDIMPESVDIEIVDTAIIMVWPDTELKGNNPDWHGFVERASSILNTMGASLYERTNAYIDHSQSNPNYVTLTPRGAVITAYESFKVKLRNRSRNMHFMLAVSFIGSGIGLALLYAIVKVYILHEI